MGHSTLHSDADPSRPSPRWTPSRLYGALAAAEAVTWALLLAGMALKYSGVSRAFVPVFGLIHGVAFLAYCVVTCFVWVNERWAFGVGAAGLLSAFVPFGSLPFERWLERRGKLSGRWRLASGGEAPRTVMERLEAGCLRRPGVALIGGLLLIAGLTALLLYVGPPGGRR